MNGLNRNLAEFTASLDFKKIPADALAAAGARLAKLDAGRTAHAIAAAASMPTTRSA